MKLASALCLASCVGAYTFAPFVDSNTLPHAVVEDHITNEHCKEHYIKHSKPVCVLNGQCFPFGSDETHDCTSVEHWRWPDHAVGVNPSPINRVTKNGDDKRKLVWAYASSITQGEAVQIYNKEGQVTVDNLLNTPVNQVAFIANVNVENASKWFVPGANNTNGCGQRQTWELPFGYDGKSSQVQEFQDNLKKLHQAGLTVTLTMGSWCTQFPITSDEEWTTAQFNEFVTYFRELRANIFGNNLDGVDFDWEGFCKIECLKGECACAWDDQECGGLTPEALAAGHTWMVTDSNGTKHEQMCWMLPTSSTFQVMTGIAHYLKKAGFITTLVPMSVAMYTGEVDKSSNQVMRNEYIKYRNHTFEGVEVDLMDECHAILLQWYSGFDAGLCHNSDGMECACNNVPDDDYPNVLNISSHGSDGNASGGDLIMAYWTTHPGVGGNMFPKTFPVRCQACGKNVTLPNGKKGEYPCAEPDEEWFMPALKRINGSTPPALLAEHKAKYANYTETKKSVPYWWVKGTTQPSHCPRAIDCPDWQYEGEPRYSRMLKLITSLDKVVDISKVAIGFETMGGDVLAQFEAYEDPALPWSTVSQEEIWNATKYYNNCTTNITIENAKDGKRCGQPLLSQVWGPKFNASDIVGFEAAVKSSLGKDLAGVGLFTVDGVLAQAKGQKKRMWYDAICQLNQTYKIPCGGSDCACPQGGSTPTPAPGPSGPTPPPSTPTPPPSTPTPPPSTPTPPPAAPTPTPAQPTPPTAPTPLATMYSCDFMTGSPVCKLDPNGWTDKAGCDKVCVMPSPGPGPGPATPTPAPAGPTPSPDVPQPISASDIAALWKEVGGSSGTCAVAVAVALAESGKVGQTPRQGDCHAVLHNHGGDIDGTTDRGLWQLNSKYHTEVSDTCAYDCKCCAQQTLRISGGGSDFSTWTTFKKGIYKTYLGQATTACA